MQVIFHCWNLNNLHGAPGGPTAFGMSTDQPTRLSSATPGSHRPKTVPVWEKALAGSKRPNFSETGPACQAQEENCSHLPAFSFLPEKLTYNERTGCFKNLLLHNFCN